MKMNALTPETLHKKLGAVNKQELTLKIDALTPELLHKMDAYWRAANYLSVGQIYLYDNPLLKRTTQTFAREASGGRTLGNHSGPELHLCAPEPGHQEV